MLVHLVLRSMLLILVFCSQILAGDLSLGEIMAGVQSERAKLRNGEFRATGSIAKKDAFKPLDNSGPEWIQCEFDFVSGDLITTVDRPRFLYYKDTDSGSRTIRSIYCKNQNLNEAYYYSEAQRVEQPCISICSLDSKPPGHAVKLFLDVRGIGFGADENIEVQCKLGSSVLFESKVRQTPIEVTSEKEGLTRLSCYYSNGRARYTVWINCSEGFTPVRSILEEGGEVDGTFKSRKIHQEVKTSWKQISGAWVPTSFTSMGVTIYESQDLPLTKEYTFSRELNFDWIHVNNTTHMEPLDWRSLPVSSGVAVFDERKDPPEFRGLVSRRFGK